VTPPILINIPVREPLFQLGRIKELLFIILISVLVSYVSGEGYHFI
jgi:hypothetical protein